MQESKRDMDLDEYIEETTICIIEEPRTCDMCECDLTDSSGYTQYVRQDDYPDCMFCSIECLKNFLIREMESDE